MFALDRSRTARERRHLGWRKELLLASFPTAVVLAVFAFIERFTHQRLLFASLGASAFLIYLDPEHTTNSPRTLLIAQLGGAAAGFVFVSLLGAGYWAAAAAMIATIALMLATHAVHPPAIATSLSFAFRDAPETDLGVFALALGMILLLIALERGSLWLLSKHLHSS